MGNGLAAGNVHDWRLPEGPLVGRGVCLCLLRGLVQNGISIDQSDVVHPV